MGVLTQTVAGTYNFTVPAGVTSLSVECWGGGGGGGGGAYGGGGGGGEYAADTVTVTPGNSYTYVVGAGGAGGTSGSNGTSGGNSTFDSTSVVAHGGSRGTTGSPGSGGSGGSGSSNTTHHNGGAGASGTSSSVGGGGGSSAGPGDAGNAASGQAGGLSVTGGGPGGNGGSVFGCVDATTRIWIVDDDLPDGGAWTHYLNVNAGDMTLALDGDGSVIQAEVQGVAAHPGSWYVVKVTGDLIAMVTHDHRWYVKDDTDTWVYRVTDELLDTDRVMLQDGTLVAWGDQRKTPVFMFRQTVWCPTTSAGNWLAWRPDSAYYIGNKP